MGSNGTADLTLPVGREAKGLPLIIHPHGGPYGVRDDWGFNPEIQFLANRGYAVLQINFRGSGGYGRAHLEAVYLDGLKMQDDLTDGVRWAIAEGIADPARIAIVRGELWRLRRARGVDDDPEL